MNTQQVISHARSCLRAALAICLIGFVSPVFAGLTISQFDDAPAWPGTPTLSTTGNLNLQTDFNVEVTIRPQNCESTAATCNGAAVHTFVPDTTFQLDRFMIRLAGAPASGELYIYPEPVGGTDADGFTDVSFSTSLINGGAGMPFSFAGNPSRRLVEFNLTGPDEIFLTAGTKYAIDIRNVSAGTTACDGSSPCMYWLRAGNAAHLNDYLPGSIYATNNNTNPGQRFDVGGGRRDGTLALYAPGPPGLIVTNRPDATAWPPTPVHTTTGSTNLQTDWNTEVTLAPGGAVTHTFVPDTTFKLDKFMIRAAGAPTTGELYLYQEPVGGTESDGFVNVGFGNSLLTALPFTFTGVPDRTLLEFDLLGNNEITLQAGVKYAIDIRNTGSDTMYWLRGETNLYSGGNIYTQANAAGDTQRFDTTGGGRLDGSLALFAAGVPGDFNNDGKVDAGDYVTWRKNETANASLPNDNGATTQAARYSLWRSSFGNPPGAGAGLNGGAIPEPSAWMLAMAAIGLFGLRRSTR